MGRVVAGSVGWSRTGGFEEWEHLASAGTGSLLSGACLGWNGNGMQLEISFGVKRLDLGDWSCSLKLELERDWGLRGVAAVLGC